MEVLPFFAFHFSSTILCGRLNVAPVEPSRASEPHPPARPQKASLFVGPYQKVMPRGANRHENVKNPLAGVGDTSNQIWFLGVLPQNFLRKQPD
jgi:hypothetical protein